MSIDFQALTKLNQTLIPCPFCGAHGPDDVEILGYAGDMKFVSCSKCGARGPGALPSATISEDQSCALAARHWNERAIAGMLLPLKWEGPHVNNYDDWKTVTYMASTLFGHYEAEILVDLDGDTGQWARRIVMAADFSDRGADTYPCKSLRKAKQRAWVDWCDRMSSMLFSN